MLKFDQNLQDSNWDSDCEDEKDIDIKSLNEILLHPELLGEGRDMIVELKSAEGSGRLVQITH